MTTIKQRAEAVLHHAGWSLKRPEDNASPYWEGPGLKIPGERLFLGPCGSIRIGPCKSQSMPLMSSGRRQLLAQYTGKKLHVYRNFLVSQRERG